jgi:hypothetical protein
VLKVPRPTLHVQRARGLLGLLIVLVVRHGCSLCRWCQRWCSGEGDLASMMMMAGRSSHASKQRRRGCRGLPVYEEGKWKVVST